MKFITTLTFLMLITAAVRAEIVDLSKFQTPAKDQKDRNTCAYFAATGLVESALKVTFDREYDISEQFQVYYGKEHFGEYADSEHGDTYGILHNFRQQLFFYKEADIPYQTSLFENGRECSDYSAFDPSAPIHCFSQGPISIEDSFHKVNFRGLKVKSVTGLWSSKSRAGLIIDELKMKRSVVLTMLVYPPYWKNDGTTHFDESTKASCDSGEKGCYGHAILITGYDSDKKLFFFKNSWGEKWGNSGYGNLSFEYVDRWSYDPVTAYFDRFAGDLLD